MRLSRRRLWIAALIIVISAAIIIAAAGPILSYFLREKIKARLEAADIRISSLSINLFTRSISVKDLEWSDKARVKEAYAGGIRIVPLLREKKISLRNLTFSNGSVDFKVDTTARADSAKVKSIDIDKITFNNIDVKVHSDTATEYSGNVGLILYHLRIDSGKYDFRNVEVNVKDVLIHHEGALADFMMKSATFDKELMKLHIDSLQLKPLYNKTEFAKKVKSQDTRTTLAIASIDATGVNMGVHMQDTAIMVSSITINGPMVHAYKNKKYPFTRKEKFPLPMESFRALKFGIEVDSIKVHDGKITYEELPAEGFNTAWITFEDVEVTMNSVNNRDFKNLSGYSTLEASAHVMKTGQIKATFKVPLGSRKNYSAEGTVRDLPLRELNPLLKDLAFVEMASGKLNRMDFAFNYDDNISRGQLNFDYRDLKILGLKKERDKDVSPLKTLVLNAVKNDDNLTGGIDVKRNQRKAVFNLWTISIADGIMNGLMPRRKDKKDKGKG
jgi:hypothetical protein